MVVDELSRQVVHAFTFRKIERIEGVAVRRQWELGLRGRVHAFAARS